MELAATARSFCHVYSSLIPFSPLVFRVVAHGFVDHFPACTRFAHQPFVSFAIEVIKLELKLAVTVESAWIDSRFSYCATGFSYKKTETKSAVPGYRQNVSEGVIK